MDSTWTNEIRKRINGIPARSGRSDKFGRISFNDLVFVPAQMDKRPIDYFKEEIRSETLFGRESKKPLRIKLPIIFGAMSFGALSKEAKIALAESSSQAGIIANTGEGGMLPEEREKSERLIVQYSTGRFGITEEVLKKADAIEIKMGQGAKPGSGGMLLKNKITPEIAEVRKVSGKEDIHSPAYHEDINSPEELKRIVEGLRNITGGVPISIKMGAGNIEKDIGYALKADPDIIALDGMEGGTGAAPEVLLDEMGIPTIPSLVRARKFLDDSGSDAELWIGGGFNKGGDIAKALALGADGIFMSFPLLISMGCIYCRQCHLGKCLKGIATQNPDLRKNFDMDNSVKNVVEFINSCGEEIKIIAGAAGKEDIHDLTSDDLRSLTSEMAKITETKTVWNS